MNKNEIEYPIIVVENPHQLPPRAYIFESESELVRHALLSVSDDWEWPENETADDYIDAISHDLHQCFVFDRADALEWLQAHAAGNRYGHQHFRVEAVLRRACEDLEWIKEYPKYVVVCENDDSEVIGVIDGDTLQSFWPELDEKCTFEHVCLLEDVYEDFNIERIRKALNAPPDAYMYYAEIVDLDPIPAD